MYIYINSARLQVPHLESAVALDQEKNATNVRSWSEWVLWQCYKETHASTCDVSQLTAELFSEKKEDKKKKHYARYK